MERYLIYGLVVLVVLGAAWGKGYLMGSERLNDYIQRQAQEETRIAGVRERVTTKVLTRYIQVAGATKTVTETIEKEVVKYANTTHCLDAQWARLHDGAALNIPPSAVTTDGEIGAPTAAQAIEAVTQSYAACHRTADRLDNLQTWVKEQSQVK